MNSLLKLFVVTAVVFLFSQAGGYATAQRKEALTGYIDFAPVRVTLGMPKGRTMALLGEHYNVTPWKGVDGEDSWAVSEQKEPHIVSGSLTFANGEACEKQFPIVVTVG